jgi:hypothetical protein
MDILNDLLHSNPPNPLNEYLSDSEISENEEYIGKLKKINERKKRKHYFTFDDWSMLYSDDLWNLWCIIEQFRQSVNILDNMDFPTFCSMCYENSSRV